MSGVSRKSLADPASHLSTATPPVGWTPLIGRLSRHPQTDSFSWIARSASTFHITCGTGAETWWSSASNSSSLYDPALDLVAEFTDGRIAGYSLYWLDPTTKVGLVEPIRVEDEFQRRGLASAMLTAGIDRLVARGVERVKISYGSEAAAGTYRGVGFRPTSIATWYRQSAEWVVASGRRGRTHRHW